KLDGQDTLLKRAGMGVRWGKPSVWKPYLDPTDTLSDVKPFAESPNEALAPGYTLTLYVTDPSTLVRQDAEPAGFDSPFLHSAAGQKAVVLHLTFVRAFDIDIFVMGVRKKWKQNGFPETGWGDLATDKFPEDRPARDAFNHAYQKVGWYERGDTVDFVAWAT